MLPCRPNSFKVVHNPPTPSKDVKSPTLFKVIIRHQQLSPIISRKNPSGSFQWVVRKLSSRCHTSLGSHLAVRQRSCCLRQISDGQIAMQISITQICFNLCIRNLIWCFSVLPDWRSNRGQKCRYGGFGVFPIGEPNKARHLDMVCRCFSRFLLQPGRNI